MGLQRPEGEDAEAEPEEDIESPLPNLLDLFFYFEQVGIGFSREEVFRLWLALKHLVDTQPVQHVRWLQRARSVATVA